MVFSLILGISALEYCMDKEDATKSQRKVLRAEVIHGARLTKTT